MFKQLAIWKRVEQGCGQSRASL